MELADDDCERSHLRPHHHYRYDEAVLRITRV
jgi:hypothetical protein